MLGYALLECLNRPVPEEGFWAVSNNYLLTERHVYLVPTQDDQTIQQRFYSSAGAELRETGPARLTHAFEANQRIMTFSPTPKDMRIQDWFLIKVHVEPSK